MPSFKELSKLYSQIREEEQNYWEKLTEDVRHLIKAVSQELGLDAKLHLGLNLGQVDSAGHFSRNSPDQLPREGQQINFALQLVLDIKDSTAPPNLLVTSWIIKGLREGVSLAEATGKEWHYSSFEGAAEAVTKAFEKQIQGYSSYSQ